MRNGAISARVAMTIGAVAALSALAAPASAQEFPAQSRFQKVMLNDRPGERANRNPAFDARRTSGNTNDLRGKILRIRVRDDGGYRIPADNLFGRNEDDTRPEIYAMGLRNPFRFAVNRRNGDVYVGDSSPDARRADPARGPAGQGRWMLIREPGNYGWPFCATPDMPPGELRVHHAARAGARRRRGDRPAVRRHGQQPWRALRRDGRRLPPRGRGTHEQAGVLGRGPGVPDRAGGPVGLALERLRLATDRARAGRAARQPQLALRLDGSLVRVGDMEIGLEERTS